MVGAINTFGQHQGADGLQKIGIKLPQGGDWPPAEMEWVWASPLRDGNYKLMNVPFYARDLAYGDIVGATEQRSGESNVWWLFTHVVARSGHSTYRLFVFKGTNALGFAHFWQEFARLGCTYEAADERLVAVDMGPDVDVTAAYSILEKGCAEGVWDFEEGYFAVHPGQ